MSALPNPRHERFAQERANGQTIDKSYELAGYTPNRGNASTLNAQQSISKRIDQIFAERERKAAKILEISIERAAVTRAWVLARLRENAERSLKIVPVRDSEGTPIGEYRYEGSVANRALELLGKEIGMFIDRKHVTHADAPAAEMAFEQLLAIAQGRVIEHRADETVPDLTDVSAEDGSDDG